MTSSRQHGYTTSSRSEPSVPEPSYAERVRTLVHRSWLGTLSTLSERHPGWPFGSLMPYGLDESGRPTVLISTMAMHTRNIERDPRVSLFVSETDSEGDPLGASRVTLMGRALKVPEEELGKVRELYLSRYGNARYWVDFDDFFFYMIEIEDIYFVGGFGAMGWIAIEDYYTAEVDPLADAAPEIVRHMNEDHTDSLVLLAKRFTGVDADEALMTAVDRLGFHVRLKSGGEVQSRRIGFPREVKSPAQTREVLVEMIRGARR